MKAALLFLLAACYSLERVDAIQICIEPSYWELHYMFGLSSPVYYRGFLLLLNDIVFFFLITTTLWQFLQLYPKLLKYWESWQHR